MAESTVHIIIKIKSRNLDHLLVHPVHDWVLFSPLTQLASGNSCCGCSALGDVVESGKVAEGMVGHALDLCYRGGREHILDVTTGNSVKIYILIT